MIFLAVIEKFLVIVPEKFTPQPVIVAVAVPTLILLVYLTVKSTSFFKGTVLNVAWISGVIAVPAYT